MKEKLICPSCGQANNDVDYCTNCGENLKGNTDPKIVNKITCPSCGYSNNSDNNFCGKCGTNLKDGKSKNQRKPRQSNQSNFSMTNYLYIGVGVIFVLILIYLFTTNDKKTPQQTTTPTQMPTSQNVPQIDVNKLRELEDQVSKDPSNKNLIIEVANAFHDANVLDKAIMYYDKYLQLDPNSTDARIDLAICYFGQNNLEAAKTEINKALKINPKHQKGWFNLGIVSLKGGNFKEATEYFQKCIDIDPKTDVAQGAKEIMEQHLNAMNKKSTNK